MKAVWMDFCMSLSIPAWMRSPGLNVGNNIFANRVHEIINPDREGDHKKIAAIENQAEAAAWF